MKYGYSIGEIAEELRTTLRPPDKVAILKKHDCAALRYFFSTAYHPDAKWTITKIPKFKPFKLNGRQNVIGYAPSNLQHESKRLYLFLETGSHMTPELTTRLFRELMERLDLYDRRALTASVLGTFAKLYRCPKKVINEAFPGLLDQPFRANFLR